MPNQMNEAPSKLKGLVLRPLAATTYLLRNGSKTIPLTGAIILAVLLVSGIVAMMNSIPYSIRNVYKYAQESLAVGPRGDPTLTPEFVSVIKHESPVPLERLILVRSVPSYVKSIVGKWPFFVVGLEQEDMDFFMKRQHVTKLDGHLPEPDEAGAVISEPVARNLGLHLGSKLLDPTNQDSYSPQVVKVVGIVHTDRWLMFMDIEYERANHFPPIDIALAYAKTPDDQYKLGSWAIKRFKGGRAQVFAYQLLESDTNDNFAILYKILDVVVGMLVLVVTFMMGMLINIYQSQRLVEFGLLQAIGYTKRQLLGRVIKETVYVLLLGWVLGLALAYAMLHIVNAILMYPHAFSLVPNDLIAYRYTVPIPIAILVVGVLTVVLRFRKFDPVGVVERRLV